MNDITLDKIADVAGFSKFHFPDFLNNSLTLLFMTI